MQLNRRQVHLQDAHVLDDERVDAGLIELPDQLAAGLQLFFVQDGVDRGEYSAMKAMRMVGQPGQITHAVVGRRAGTERRTADVHRIGSVVEGFNADVGRARRCEQFNLVVSHGQKKRGQTS